MPGEEDRLESTLCEPVWGTNMEKSTSKQEPFKVLKVTPASEIITSNVQLKS